MCFLGKRKYIYKVGSNLKYKKWTTKGSVDKVSNTKRTFIGSLIYRLCKGYRSCGASSRKCFTHKHKHFNHSMSYMLAIAFMPHKSCCVAESMYVNLNLEPFAHIGLRKVGSMGFSFYYELK